MSYYILFSVSIFKRCTVPLCRLLLNVTLDTKCSSLRKRLKNVIEAPSACNCRYKMKMCSTPP